MLFNVLFIGTYVALGIYLIAKTALRISKVRLQNEWYKEKNTRKRLNPQISKAELCEYFVMFCKRNNCKVDF